jgi:glutaredoxin
MAVERKHVDGKKGKNIMLYALSTCVWCGKTKKLLGEMGLSYDYIDVDLLDGKEQDQVLEEIKKYNPRGGFPTIVIEGKDCIVGFDRSKIEEKLGLG